MWAQTTRYVYIAVNIPTKYADKELHMNARRNVLILQTEDSPPVVERQFAFTFSDEFPIQTMQSDDKRLYVLSIPKKNMEEEIKHVFEGDPDYVRCLKPPYTLHETNSETIMELKLPFWTDEEDVHVDITKYSVRIRVRNKIDTKRTFWRKNEGPQELRDGWEAIVPEECAWSLDENINAKDEKCRILMICFAKPACNEEERNYQKGTRQDNRFARSKCASNLTGNSGTRFFYEDEDEFDLEAMLIASCFMETDSSFVPAKPENDYRPPHESSKVIDDVKLLPERCKKILHKLLDVHDDNDDDNDDDDGNNDKAMLTN